MAVCRTVSAEKQLCSVPRAFIAVILMAVLAASEICDGECDLAVVSNMFYFHPENWGNDQF